MKIPYARQWVDEEDIKAVEETLRGDWLTTGPKVDEFERKIADYVGAKYAVAVNSGTSALDIAVASLELPSESEIITTPFTFAATANCILYNSCKPVFADIKPDTYNIDPKEIRKKITGKTKAILYVDYAGQPCDIEEIKEIAQEHDLKLIEDAAHALGAEYHGKKVGAFADITEFSFHPVKHITTGEGGLLTTGDESVYSKLRMLRNHGLDKGPSERTGYGYDLKMLGRNYRITDIQCALGISQLKKLGSFLERRREIAGKYTEAFAKLPGIQVPHIKEDVAHAWHLYPILVPNRDEFFKKMREKEILVNVHYLPVYSLTYYKNLGYGNLPITDDVSSKEISLPMFPKMTDEEVERVIRAVGEVVE